MNRHLIISAAVSIVSTMAACTDSLSLDGMGEAALSMTRASESPVLFNSAEPESNPRALSSDTVQSFFITVTSIEFQSQDATPGSSEGWSRLDFGNAVRIDLMSLPEEGTTARLVADGHVAAGSYRAVRLTISNPTIAFKGDVSFGIGSVLQAGVNYDVLLPPGSAIIEAVALFTVDAAADSSGTRANVGLEFDAASSLAAVALSSNGSVLISPVIR